MNSVRRYIIRFAGVVMLVLFAALGYGQKYSSGKTPTNDKSRIALDKLRKGTKPNQVLMTLGDSTLKYVDADTASAIFGAELGWGKEGNSGISKHVNFIGTTDTGSFVIKANSIKLGDFSGYNKGIGIGQGANATGQNSGVFGWNSTASGIGSFAAGENNTASGSYSIAIGTNAVALKNASVSLGNTNLASGLGSLAMGQETEAYGYASASIGYVTKAVGKSSFSSGYQTVTSGMGSAVFGTFNDIDVPADSNGINAANRLFQIGNGTGISGNRSNALTVLQSGNIGIGTTTPTTKLDISGGANVSGLRLNGLSNSTTKVASGNALGYDNSGNIVPIDGRPYKVYTALLTQTGTSAPTAVVLENTLGGVPVWTRTGAGIYRCTLASAFTDLKTIAFVTETSSANGTRLTNYVVPPDMVVFSTIDFLDYISEDWYISIEIRVYN